MANKSSHLSNRRSFLKQSGFLSLAAMGGWGFPFVSRAAPLDGIARGAVFLDENRSGQARGQRGLPGILVSNGVDIAVTGPDGSYRLPVTNDTILYVIKPRGFRTALDDLNLPRFYYLHKPNGSPDHDFIYKGIAPTGPLPDRIDFPLYEQAEADSFEVLFTADPQPYNLQHLHWYARENLPEFQSLRVAFGIALGDIVGDHLDLFEPYNQINARTGFPWYNVIGNHDLNFKAKEDRYSAETFHRTFGPSTHAFQYGPVHFIVLNNIYWEGFTRMRRDGWPRRGQYRGHLRSWQLQFVRNYLQHVPSEERVVICSHIPMTNLPHYGPAHETPEFRDLLEILSGHRHTLSFSGHTHFNMNYFAGSEMGYQPPGGSKHHHCNINATCGSWYRGPYDQHGVPYAHGRDGTPKGYAVVHFDGASKYEVRYKTLGMPESWQINVSVPELVRRSELGETVVHANVFNGTSRNETRMRLDGGRWIPMRQEMTVDPAYLDLVRRNEICPEAGGGPLRDAFKTDHHWVAFLPEGLSNGWHQVEVQSRDMYQNVHLAKRSFVVAEDPVDLEHLSHGTREPRRTG